LEEKCNVGEGEGRGGLRGPRRTDSLMKFALKGGGGVAFQRFQGETGKKEGPGMGLGGEKGKGLAGDMNEPSQSLAG